MIATLPGHRSPQEARRARGWRRVGLVALWLLVALGAAGMLGVRTLTVGAVGGGDRVEVRYAGVTRAGLAVPFRVHLTREGGFDGPVTVAVSRRMFDRFDFQNFYPNPSAESASGRFLYYELDPPPGDVLEWAIDGRTAPDQNGSRERYEVAVLDQGRETVRVGFHVLIVP